MNRFLSVLAVLVFVLVMALPDAALAGFLPRSTSAPEAPLLLPWTQRNASGFGDKNNAAVSALEVFGGQLYAGTANDLGAQIWRSANGSNWSRIIVNGFGGFGQGVLFDMIVFNGQLYAGTGTWYSFGTTGQIWRTADGVTWERVTGAWEANTNNAGISNFAIFGGALYATTNNPNQGIEVYRSATGNSNDWTRVATGSFGLNNAYQVATGLTAFNNSLYIALEGQTDGHGVRVYRTSDGTNWTLANAPGFGNSAQYGAGGFAVHRNTLYVGTGRNDTAGEPSVSGGQIWRTADGVNWTRVATSGFGDPQNRKIEGLVSAQGTLFAFTRNDGTGTQVWSTSYGASWEPSNTPGFGSANNKAVALWSNGSGGHAGQLFLGTFNQEVGGEVWSATPATVVPLNNKIYLPITSKG